tara:strand:- start:79 stop:528 length:450 start_codon:yes stop_codon:yes gene_type:complete
MYNETDEIGRQFSSLIIFDDGKRILLLLRAKDKVKFSNMWSFPGGGSEIGEMPHQTAFREAYEETGLRADVGNLKEIVATKSGNKNVYFFRSESWSGEVDIKKVKTEHQKYRWVPYDELENYKMPPNNLHLIKKSKAKSLNEIKIVVIK